mmetsp:Transcript_107517/g.272858  ORF Transcript_107517/g.272858 Transcript_107517/m.272858 type:complete len:205 (+) Transcript_107517:669-1283(+)
MDPRRGSGQLLGVLVDAGPVGHAADDPADRELRSVKPLRCEHPPARGARLKLRPGPNPPARPGPLRQRHALELRLPRGLALALAVQPDDGALHLLPPCAGPELRHAHRGIPAAAHLGLGRLRGLPHDLRRRRASLRGRGRALGAGGGLDRLRLQALRQLHHLLGRPLLLLLVRLGKAVALLWLRRDQRSRCLVGLLPGLHRAGR